MPLIGQGRIRSPSTFSRYPPEIRFSVNRSPRDLIHVVEDPPQFRSIIFKPGKYNISEGETRQFRIKKPWSYFVVSCAEMSGTQWPVCFFFFATKKLTSLYDSGLVAAPMPNVIYVNGMDPTFQCCLGKGISIFGENSKDFVMHCHERFWNSTFNDEYAYPRLYIPEEILPDKPIALWPQALEKWEKLSSQGIEPKWQEVRGDKGVPVTTIADALDHWSPKWRIAQ